MRDPEAWRDSYDNWKTTDPAESEEPEPCERCGGSGCPDCFETPCPQRDDGKHCNCWYDDDPCCACGDDGEVAAKPEGGTK